MSRRAGIESSSKLAAAAVFLSTLSAGTLTAQTEGPSLEKLEKYRRDTMLAAGFVPLVLGDTADRQVSLVAGQGQPIVFLHGVGNQGSAWFEVAPAFAGSYRVVVPDLAGHGESAPAEGDLAMATIVGGAERLLLEVTKERPAILVGNSMGAWIATLLALRHPQQVERIVLVNGGPLPGEPGGPSLLPKSREEAARLMALLRDPAAPPLPDWLLDDLVGRAPTGPTARLTRDLPGLVAHLLIGRLGEVRTPVDLLWGASDQLMKLSYAERLALELPLARLTQLAHCGHIPPLECAPAFVNSLQTLLASPPPTPPAAAVSPIPAPGTSNAQR
jgi:pimeloyl-ACP methyl ester carboxylesterase